MDNLFKEENIRKTFLIVSIALYVLSLTQNCYCVSFGGCNPSIAGLILGPLLLFELPYGFTWFANPAILLAWICFKKDPKIISLATSIIAILLSLSLLFFKTAIHFEYNSTLITEYELGYWLWVSSAIVMLVGNLLLIIQKNKAPIKVT